MSARSTYQSQENTLFNSPAATAELNNPGYNAGEQSAILSAGDQATAGAGQAAQAEARNATALTGNGAGLSTALQRMQDTAGAQAAKQAADSEENIGKARIQGEQNAIGAIGENQRSATDDEEKAQSTGFWANFMNSLGSGLGKAATGAAAGGGYGAASGGGWGGVASGAASGAGSYNG